MFSKTLFMDALKTSYLPIRYYCSRRDNIEIYVKTEGQTYIEKYWK